MFHVHFKDKVTSFSYAFRLNADRTVTHFNNLLCYHESKADSLAVLRCCALEFTEEAKQMRHVFWAYSYPSVFHSDMQSLGVFIIEYNHLNRSLVREL